MSDIDSLNVLYYSLAFGFLVLVGFISYSAFYLPQTFKELSSILFKVNAMVKDLDDFRNIIKTIVLNLLKILKRNGGEMR